MLMRLRLELRDCSLGDLLHVGSEFPSLEVLQATAPASDFTIDARDWESPSWDSFAFDAHLVPALENGPATVDVIGSGCARAALTLVTRYQRFAPWSNIHLAMGAFTDLLGKLVSSDHGLDTRAWLLRLDPDASTQLRVSYVLRRMSAAARRYLPYVRMPAKVTRLLCE